MAVATTLKPNPSRSAVALHGKPGFLFVELIKKSSVGLSFHEASAAAKAVKLEQANSALLLFISYCAGC